MANPEPRASASRYLPIRAGHTIVLDDTILEHNSCLNIRSGLVRVAISRPEQEAPLAPTITLGFLQSGDHLTLDLLRSAQLHLQALTPALLEGDCSPIPPIGASSLHDWTASLLMIHHLGDAQQRLQALLRLLIRRLGRRCNAWYELPLYFTHAELAELSGQNRVTVTRQLSRWRDQGLIQQTRSARGESRQHLLRLAPYLVES